VEATLNPKRLNPCSSSLVCLSLLLVKNGIAFANFEKGRGVLCPDSRNRSIGRIMRKMIRAVGARAKYRLYITCARDQIESARKALSEVVNGDMALDGVECRNQDESWTELEVRVSGERLLDSWLAVLVTRLERERGIRGIEMRAAG
jgi:hypothetical protein